jgi:hypothetical protein
VRGDQVVAEVRVGPPRVLHVGAADRLAHVSPRTAHPQAPTRASAPRSMAALARCLFGRSPAGADAVGAEDLIERIQGGCRVTASLDP